MYRTKNTGYLLRRWIPICLIVVLLGAGVIYWASNLEVGLAAILFAVIILLPIMIAILTARRQTAKIQKLLTMDTPDALVAFYDALLSKARNREAASMLIGSKVLALIAYGKFSLASDQLNSIHWPENPPLLASFELYLRALLEHLQFSNFRAGLEKAVTARRMADAPTLFPGVTLSLRAADAIVDASRLLAGEEDPAVLPRLELETQTLPPMQRAVFYALLAKYHENAGDKAKAEQSQRMHRAIVPHAL